MIIYKATSKANGKVYIGLTAQTLRKRLDQHLCATKKPMPFQIALRRDGIDGFDFEVIDRASTRKELCEREKHWICFYRCRAPQGYNLTGGGDGLFDPSPEVRERMGRSRRGKPSPKRGIKTGKPAWNSGLTGFTHGEATRRKMSEIRKGIPVVPRGVPLSDSHRAAISRANKGRPAHNKGVAPWNKGVKGLVAWNKGKAWSEDARRKLSESHMGNRRTPESIIKQIESATGHKPTARIVARDSKGRILKASAIT